MARVRNGNTYYLLPRNEIFHVTEIKENVQNRYICRRFDALFFQLNFFTAFYFQYSSTFKTVKIAQTKSFINNLFHERVVLKIQSRLS